MSKPSGVDVSKKNCPASGKGRDGFLLDRLPGPYQGRNEERRPPCLGLARLLLARAGGAEVIGHRNRNRDRHRGCHDALLVFCHATMAQQPYKKILEREKGVKRAVYLVSCIL